MKTLIGLSIACLLALTFCGVSLGQSPVLDEATTQRMAAAMPAPVQTGRQEPRKLLIFTLVKAFPHSAIPFGAKALEIMGGKTGAYLPVVSDDIAMFEPENLKQFDAVCLMNTTGELFLPANYATLEGEAKATAEGYDRALKKSFADFIRSGKGLIGIHAATDCFYEWPEYGEMIGGYFDDHPWTQEVTLTVEDPAHPVCEAFEGTTFKVDDEIYQFREPYSREKLRVLLTVDTHGLDMNVDGRVHRMDGDFAVSWVKKHGKGRVFYCSLGHREEIFWNPTVLKHFLDGIRFAMGDLFADATPSAALPKEYFGGSAAELSDRTLRLALEEIRSFTYGEPAAAMREIERRINESKDNAVERAKIANGLVTLLEGEVTDECRRFACKMLALCGTSAEVKSLAAELENPALSELALYALTAIPGPEADAALVEAAAKTEGAAKIAVLNAIGARGIAGAEQALQRALRSGEPALADAAATALGNLGTARSARILGAAEASEAQEAALLRCGERLTAAGKSRSASRIFRKLAREAQGEAVRGGALLCLAKLEGAKRFPEVLSALESEEPGLRQAAVEALRVVEDPELTSAIIASLPEQNGVVQAALVKALGERGQTAALPAVLAAVESDDAEVRLAALRALPALGDATCVKTLAERATTTEGAEQEAAKAALANLRGEAVDAAILEGIEEASDEVRITLIHALAARDATEAVPALLERASSRHTGVLTAVFQALGSLASPEDLPALLEVLGCHDDGEVRPAAVGAAVAVSKQTKEPPAAALVALAGAEQPCEQENLLRVLGGIGDDAALEALRSASRDGDARVRQAAISALASWPNGAVLDDLLRQLETTEAGPTRATVVDGLARLLLAEATTSVPLEKMASVDRVFEVCKKAMSLAPREELLLAAAQLAATGTEAFLRNYLKDDAWTDAATHALEILEKQALLASASLEPGAAPFLIDGELWPLWTTQQRQEPGQWIMVDLRKPRMVDGVELDSEWLGDIPPKGYRVLVSNDRATWREPKDAKRDPTAANKVGFPPTEARFIAVVVTEKDTASWIIQELRIGLE